MEISKSSYSAFWANPEQFRLSRLLGIVKAEPAHAIGRGTVMHLEVEGYCKGWSSDEVALRLQSEVPPLSADMIREGKLLAFPLKEFVASNGTVLEVEREFKVPIPNTDHWLTGIYDAVVRKDNGSLVVREYKSAGKGRRQYEFPKEFKAAPQACFNIIGAVSHGYEVNTVEFVVVQEGTPITVTPYEVVKTPYELEYQLLAAGITCDIIQHLVRTFGLDRPWPHVIHSQWASDVRGACNNGWCDYQDICGQELKGIPEGFIQGDKKEVLL